MTQTMDLNKMELTLMNELEIQEIQGGGFWDVIKGVAIGIAIGLLI